VMPRIIGGAHWLTDFVVGGMAFAFAAVSWAVHTPLAGASCRALHRLFLRMQPFIGLHLDRRSAYGSHPSSGNGNRPGGP
jgi:membrane-associated phospholipid phosphatase